ncbi:hypothetical protein NB311A_14430 [Nitrobacter sp. Nb-311A]|uniref:hypothetical protein n=1 Tax=unclassified Nitrobacter TaxID=2620411 RepID=UPI000068711E|nr:MULTISPECIES: hypothetical protein [unclassified Nitrobacter]EAQ35100.1 hypothetical protein NB311A_14430 [Nitrobacter sp. Nb-311A]MCB1392996.1 hypothetical protein [Nitrobacter sp.]MCV0385543.1 hypothetical protein [Nitrobacter sp.]
MTDRTGLKIVGLLFASVTLAVALATWIVVKRYADGIYSLDNVAVARIAPR